MKGGGRVWEMLALAGKGAGGAPFEPPQRPPPPYLQEKQQQPQHAPLSLTKASPQCLPVFYNGKGISAFSRAREVFIRSNWDKVEFLIKQRGGRIDSLMITSKCIGYKTSVFQHRMAAYCGGGI